MAEQVDNMLDKTLRLETLTNLYQDWMRQRKQSEQTRARMVLAMHDAYAAGYNYQDLADTLGLSRQRIGQYLDGTNG
jgi:aryl-alcohol dehydrogenase-like predicted oxidoreductase